MKKTICVLIALCVTILTFGFGTTCSFAETNPDAAINGMISLLGEPQQMERAQFASVMEPFIDDYGTWDLFCILDYDSSISVMVNSKNKSGETIYWTINGATEADLKKVYTALHLYVENTGISDNNLCFYIHKEADNSMTCFVNVTGQEADNKTYFDSIDSMLYKAAESFHESLATWVKNGLSDKQEQQILNSDEQSELLRMFQEIDTNGNGILDMDELFNSGNH